VDNSANSNSAHRLRFPAPAIMDSFCGSVPHRADDYA